MVGADKQLETASFLKQVDLLDNGGDEIYMASAAFPKLPASAVLMTFYCFNTLYFHVWIKNNILFNKVFIHIQLIITIRLITNQTERFALVWCDKIKQASISKGSYQCDRQATCQAEKVDGMVSQIIWEIFKSMSKAPKNLTHIILSDPAPIYISETDTSPKGSCLLHPDRYRHKQQAAASTGQVPR